MTGCYDIDDCLFQSEATCEDKDHKDRCKWKTEWAQCVPQNPCPKIAPVTVDDYHKLSHSGRYKAMAERKRTKQAAQAEHAHLQTSTDTIGALYASTDMPDKHTSNYTTITQRMDLLSGKVSRN